MNEKERLKQELEQAIEERNTAWVKGRAPRAWQMAVARVGDLSERIQLLEKRNAPKPVMAPWLASQLDMDWDED